MSRPARCVLLALALTLAASVARADVLVVDAGGGGEFTSLHGAVATASSGDTIVVRPGTYLQGTNTLLIGGKDLVIQADGTGIVRTPPVLVTAAAAGRRIVLRGLDIEQTTTDPRPGLQVAAGEVWVEDCRIEGGRGEFSIGAMPAFPGLLVGAGAAVVALRCTATGGAGVDSFFPYAPTPGEGGAGAEVDGGRLDAWDCTFVAGPAGDFVGFDGGPGPGGLGIAGVLGDDATVFLAGGAAQGGDGGDGDELVPSPGWYGGGDAVALGGASVLRVRDVELQPGTPGTDGNGAPGPAGTETDVPDGTVTTWERPYRGFQLDGPTPEGGAVTLAYSGEPHDVFSVYFALSPASVPLPGKQGMFQLGSPFFGPITFPVDATGDFELVVPLGDFGFGPDDAVLLHEQVFVGDTSGKILLGSPSTHLILDDSF